MLNGPMKAGVTACVIAVLAAPALAQSSLGIGSNEVAPVATSGLFGWIYAEQQQFFRALQAALSRMRDDGTGAMALIGLSFAYGVFHAAGPGHGKAVISSWLIANDAQLKRGIALSFASSAMQAVSAILLVGAAFLVLRAISISMTDAAWVLEMASYGLIMGFGAVLLWRKVAGGGHSHGDSLQHQHDGHDHRHAHHHDDHDHIGQGHHHHHHVDGEACAACGHAHAPSPAAVSSQTFSLAEAWGIIAAVGMRPCSGAIVVLSFALLNGLYVAGLASVFVMALGTAITVSALAILAVHAKGLTQRLAGAHAATTGHAIEILGALAVFALGAGMLYAGLTA